jgi:hypothetical protein
MVAVQRITAPQPSLREHVVWAILQSYLTLGYGAVMQLL